MLTLFDIEGFKIFDRFTLEDIPRITLLGGKNNVGKSTFLEAVFLFHDRFSPEILIRHLGFRGIRSYTSDSQTFFAPNFHRYETSRKIRLAAKRESIDSVEIRFAGPSKTRSIQLNAVERLPERAHPQGAHTNDLMDTILEIKYRSDDGLHNEGTIAIANGELKLDLEKALDPAASPTAVYIGTRRQDLPEEVAKRFGELDVIGEAEMVVDFLRIVCPEIKSLSAVATEQGSIVHADIGFERKVPVNFLGDGVNRLLSMFLSLARAKDGILLVDDFGSGLHFSILPTIWKSISEASTHFNCQVIATTHSYACLEAAHKAFGELLTPDFAYYRLERQKKDIEAKRFSFDTLGAALEHGWEVR